MSEVTGKGTLFRKWTGAAWENLANIQSIEGPDKSRETIETTTLDTEGGYKTFIAGLRDAGSISLSMIFSRASFELMNTDFESDIPQQYEIVLPDDETTTLEFEGLVTELPLSITADDVIKADVTIKISGKVEMNSGSGS